jgi:hypothetical protein
MGDSKLFIQGGKGTYQAQVVEILGENKRIDGGFMVNRYSVAFCLNGLAMMMFSGTGEWYGVAGVLVHALCARFAFDLNAENEVNKIHEECTRCAMSRSIKKALE